MNSQEVCNYAGITYRQLDHWTTRGYIAPADAQDRNPGTGKVREWTRHGAETARRIRTLVELGFTLPIAVDVAHGPPSAVHTTRGGDVIHIDIRWARP